MRSFAVTLIALCLTVSAHAEIQPGSRPPDSLGKTVSGESVTLTALRDKVVVISFWATWCTYCMKELPILAGLQAQATERKLPVQVVAIEHKEDRTTFVRTSRALRPRLPGLLMSWDRDGSIGKPFGTDQGIPVMVMLHRDGTVAHVYSGYSADMLDGMLAEINTLMAEPSSLAPTAAGTAPAKSTDRAN